MKKHSLVLEQIDRKILQFKKVADITIPSSGWVYAIRLALGMSLRQLGKKMGITAQSVKEIEKREQRGSVSLNVLRLYAKSLDMKLVYGFIPEHESLEKMIEKQAIHRAKEIVSRTSISMKLEDQENNPTRIKKAVREKAQEIKLEMPKYLWD